MDITSPDKLAAIGFVYTIVTTLIAARVTQHSVDDSDDEEGSTLRLEAASEAVSALRRVAKRAL